MIIEKNADGSGSISLTSAEMDSFERSQAIIERDEGDNFAVILKLTRKRTAAVVTDEVKHK